MCNLVETGWNYRRQLTTYLQLGELSLKEIWKLEPSCFNKGAFSLLLTYSYVNTCTYVHGILGLLHITALQCRASRRYQVERKLLVLKRQQNPPFSLLPSRHSTLFPFSFHAFPSTTGQTLQTSLIEHSPTSTLARCPLPARPLLSRASHHLGDTAGDKIPRVNFAPFTTNFHNAPGFFGSCKFGGVVGDWVTVRDGTFPIFL